MLASLTDAPLDDPQLVYEPKYDGIRAIAEVAPGKYSRLWSRLGNEKTHQFPEVARALDEWARRLSRPVVLDGEIVALDEGGRPTGFQQLQRLGGRERVAVSAPLRTAKVQKSSPAPNPTASAAFIAFDLLRDGPHDLRERPFLERRAALERLFGERELTSTQTRQAASRPPVLRISEMVRGDGRALYKRALEQGWEGLIAKQADSKYRSGKRTPDWRKLKIVHEQEFVVGGWTEPRHTRSCFGALLLGVYEKAEDKRQKAKGNGRSEKDLIYVGHTGTGFNERELARVMMLLEPLETKECPFRECPKTNEKPHWVRPRLVAQIKFTEWTVDGNLRHPVYIGLRDDKKPEGVIREPQRRLHHTSERTVQGSGVRGQGSENENPEPFDLIAQLDALESARRDGLLALPGGDRLKVTNLHKVFWPKQKLTKGDLLRYYVRVNPCILPAVADRPLVMKRFPNGITGKPFYQHRAGDAPPGVRVQHVATGAESERRPQIIGGNLTTLLYTTQLAAISQDPWFSRVSSLEFADYAALDLDPSAGVKFDRVLDVARWIRDELEAIGAIGVPKTSGADGLHVYIPLPPGTPYQAGLLFCQIVATVVAQKHARVATVERSVKARGARVYVDYLQNVLGKTLATAYSARASAYAGVSAPLTWKEVDAGIRREDFTIETMPARIQYVGDLWAALRQSKAVDLTKVERYLR